MFQIVIDNIYYKWSTWLNKFNARLKKNSVYFYDYDNYVKFIIDNLSYSELWKLRLNIYKFCHDKIKFTNFKESDLNGGYFEWVKLHSDIIDIDVSDFALLLPSRDLRKKYFVRDEIRERYFYKSDFIQYVNMHEFF